MAHVRRRSVARRLGSGGLAAIVIGCAAFVESASAHHVPGTAGMSEAQLLRTETAVLGRGHALEHRGARREARRLRLGPPEAPPRVHAVGAPQTVGSWFELSGIDDIDVTGIHAVLLRTGKVLYFNYGPGETTVTALWDPNADPGGRTYENVAFPDGNNVWCAGQTLLADGRVLVVGGNVFKGSTGYKGLDTIYIFDPNTEEWTFQAHMNEGRWYPTTTLLPDGRVLITSGYVRDGSERLNADVEVFTPSPDPAGRGTVEIVSQKALDLYPFQHVVRDGRVLVTGPFKRNAGVFDPDGWGFTDAPDPAGEHYYGSAVLLPDGPEGSSKVMVIGGDQQTGTEILDAEDLAAGWTSRAPLPEKRRNANTVLTPDGALITIGGNQVEQFTDPVHEALRYDPAANTWTELAAQEEDRGYHSTALLLPDGRIVSAGDDGPSGHGGQADEIEVFSPPYLFHGARPQILSPPSAIGYGQRFAVGASADVVKAVLVAPGATTHANDMHQRLVPLMMTTRADGAGIDLTAPANAAIAPPGDYMLFVLNAAGVPSVGRFLRLSGASPAPPSGPAPVGPAVLPPPAGPSVRTARFVPMPPRPYWREGFENPVRGIRQAARVGLAHRGAKGLWIGRPATVPGPLLKPGRYRLTIWVNAVRPRMTATARGTRIRLAVVADTGRSKGWTRLTAKVTLRGAGATSVAIRLAPGGRAIVDDLELKRLR